MNGLLADCRHALRIYVSTPGASLIAVLVLAIGVAFVSAFLSLYVDLILRPHPGFEQSARIATIGQNTGTNLAGLTYEAVERIADEVVSIEAAAMFSPWPLLAGTERRQVSTSMVSEGFFSGLRPRLALGRGFRDEEHSSDAEPVVVLSYRYWQQQFDGDPNVLGTVLEITWNPDAPYQGPSGEPDPDFAQFRIVGVMAETLPGIFVPARGASAESAIWLPLERAWPLFRGTPDRLPRLATSGTLVRRAPGVSTSTVVRELRARYGDQTSLWNGFPGSQLDGIDGVVDNSVAHRDAKRQLEMFLAGSVLLALVAAANVSLFLLARAPGRRRELAVRMAVGAPIKRLARQLATEAGLLVVVSAALGLLGSIWLSFYLGSLAFLRGAEWREVTLLDWRVLSLAGTVLLALTLFVSLAPVLGIKRLGIDGASRQVTARASLTQHLAGTIQIAVAGTLGGAALAFGWYIGSMLLGNPGYETENRFFVRFIPQALTARDIGVAERFEAPLEYAIVEGLRNREAIEALPGVTAVTFGNPIPAAQSALGGQRIPDPSDPSQQVAIRRGLIDSRFVDVLGLRLRYGRVPADDEAGVALVNQALALRLFGRENAVGESIEIRNPAGPRAEVIGVLEDLSFVHPAADVDPIVFLNVPSSPFNLRGVIASTLTTAALQQSLQELTDSGELELGTPSVTPLRRLRINLIAADLTRSLLTIGAASVVVLLVAIGFYGTQTYLVNAGQREYAILASLGAGPRALRRLVFIRGLWLGLPGLAVGGVLAFIAVAWLRGDFVPLDVSPSTVTMGVVLGLIVVMLVASLGPSRKAMRTEPAPLLRGD